MIEIGSQYRGIPYDRPCLRKLPSGWTLEESKPEVSRGDRAVAIVCIGLFVAIVACELVRWLK